MTVDIGKTFFSVVAAKAGTQCLYRRHGKETADSVIQEVRRNRIGIIRLLTGRSLRRKQGVGRVLRKEDSPMGKFLVNVLAAVAAGVIVALILRYLNV
jgi:hypothetical protein